MEAKRLEDVAEGRWSDTAILGLEKAEVIYWHGESDYQGSCEYIVKVDNWSFVGPEYIVFGWSYGSCSGCDGYEDMGTNERIKHFVDGRVTYTKAALRTYGQMLLRENPEPSEYGWENGHKKALAILEETGKDDD